MNEVKLSLKENHYILKIDIDSKDRIHKIKLESNSEEFIKISKNAVMALQEQPIFETTQKMGSYFDKLEKEHLILNQLLNLAYLEHIGEVTNNMDNILCPCFKISLDQVKEVAQYYNEEFHQNDLKAFLLEQFPLVSACQTCERPLVQFIRQFERENFRETSWKSKSNAQWMKDIYLKLTDDVEIIDFYNGKLFIKTDLPTSDIQEHLKLHFEQNISVFKL